MALLHSLRLCGASCSVPNANNNVRLLEQMELTFVSFGRGWEGCDSFSVSHVSDRSFFSHTRIQTTGIGKVRQLVL